MLKYVEKIGCIAKYDEGRGSGYVRLQFILVTVHMVKGSQGKPNCPGVAV